VPRSVQLAGHCVCNKSTAAAAHAVPCNHVCADVLLDVQMLQLAAMLQAAWGEDVA
jgi:hypothetical protein